MKRINRKQSEKIDKKYIFLRLRDEGWMGRYEEWGMDGDGLWRMIRDDEGRWGMMGDDEE